MPDRWLISRRRHRCRSPAVGHLVDVFPTRVGELWITACGRLFTTGSRVLLDQNPRKLNRCKRCEQVRLKRSRSK